MFITHNNTISIYSIYIAAKRLFFILVISERSLITKQDNNVLIEAAACLFPAYFFIIINLYKAVF